ncbi:MAG: glycoside hydrolase family 16 protein [Flavobacteriales bacterium]|nr:glycoside hydrolase family 16 protein [Flavobacteriales bacterium]
MNNTLKLVFNDDFSSKELNNNNWIPFYLPHWSSKELSKPNYKLKKDGLHLQILKNQKPWCPEFNGDVKCSSIQTGLFSGKLGTNIGQHKFFNLKCLVREEQNTEKKFVPQYGYFEIKAKFLASKSNVISLWMIGFEDTPNKSAEICIMEIKGWNINDNKVKIGMGIHKFNDSKLTENFSEKEYTIDVNEFQIYAVHWTESETNFYINNIKVKEIQQSPDYPMQLMLGIYEIPGRDNNNVKEKYPKEFIIEYVKGYQ